MPKRPYIYYHFMLRICSTRLKRVGSKIVFKDMQVIPFETMNIFYRDNEVEYRKQLRNEVLV